MGPAWLAALALLLLALACMGMLWAALLYTSHNTGAVPVPLTPLQALSRLRTYLTKSLRRLAEWAGDAVAVAVHCVVSARAVGDVLRPLWLAIVHRATHAALQEVGKMVEETKARHARLSATGALPVYNVLVVGRLRAGKSSCCNAMLGLLDGSPKVAETGPRSLPKPTTRFPVVYNSTNTRFRIMDTPPINATEADMRRLQRWAQGVRSVATAPNDIDNRDGPTRIIIDANMNLDTADMNVDTVDVDVGVGGADARVVVYDCADNRADAVVIVVDMESITVARVGDVYVAEIRRQIDLLRSTNRIGGPLRVVLLANYSPRANREERKSLRHRLLSSLDVDTAFDAVLEPTRDPAPLPPSLALDASTMVQMLELLNTTAEFCLRDVESGVRAQFLPPNHAAAGQHEHTHHKHLHIAARHASSSSSSSSSEDGGDTSTDSHNHRASTAAMAAVKATKHTASTVKSGIRSLLAFRVLKKSKPSSLIPGVRGHKSHHHHRHEHSHGG